MLTKNITKRSLSKTYNTTNSKAKASISNQDKDKCLISKEDCYLVNQVVSFDNPYDKMDEFMVDEIFYEPLF
jgi:hypothetical protein